MRMTTTFVDSAWRRPHSAFIRLCFGALPFLTAQVFAQTIVLSEDFEGSFPGGWTVGDSDPFGTTAYWNTVDSAFGGEGTHGGSRKVYCAGVGFGGTTANPTYQSDMNAFLSRSINLGGYSAATLSFWYKIPSTEDGVDMARVLVDGNVVWTASAAVTSWTQATVSLNAWVGALRTLRFEFVSDASVSFEGCYLA